MLLEFSLNVQFQTSVRLWLYDNMLTGTIPAELGLMFKLQTLELEENLLTGTMPDDLCLNRAPQGLLETLESDCGGTEAPIDLFFLFYS